jgi:predicted ATPase
VLRCGTGIYKASFKMLDYLNIKDFKSIKQIELGFSRVNIFIGGNGSGKSNLLEAMAIYGAVEDNKCDNVSLNARGVRTTDLSFFLSKFSNQYGPERSSIGVHYDQRNAQYLVFLDGVDPKNGRIKYDLRAAYIHKASEAFSFQALQDNSAGIVRVENLYDEDSDGEVMTLAEVASKVSQIGDALKEALEMKKEKKDSNIFENDFSDSISRLDALVYAAGHALSCSGGDAFKTSERNELKDFIIFSPENSSLRVFDVEGKTLPLGHKGEGLYRHLKYIQEKYPESFDDILETVSMLNWIQIDDEGLGCIRIDGAEQKLMISDRFIMEELDYRCANEGFLFILFYATLFSSPDTPKIFAVDNIDIALNPKMCVVLIERLVFLAKKYNKQVFLTTHNPSILDGIDINDGDQALFVVKRNDDGCTVVDRVTKDSFPDDLLENSDINRLSEAFIRGYISDALQDF